MDSDAAAISTNPSWFSPEDEGIHQPGPSQIWQESSWVYFGNGQGMGGVVHIGQQVNIGLTNVFASGFAGDISYRKIKTDYELDRDIRASGRFNAGPYMITPINEGVRVTGGEDEFALDLTFTDQSPQLRDLTVFPNPKNHIATSTSSLNIQAPGRVQGTMRLGDQTIAVSALGQRGHSWGDRDYAALQGNGSRWITGSLGDRLNFSVYAAIRPDGVIIRSGFVVDQGRMEHTSNVEVLVTVDLDGVTYRSGVVRMIYADRTYVFRCQLDNVNLFQHHGCEITVCGGNLSVDGIDALGYSAWEINDRLPTPDNGVPFSLGSHVIDGLHRSS